MKTGYNIASKEVSLTCPKKAFIQGNIQGGIQKYKNLSTAFLNVIDTLPFTSSPESVNRQVDTEFNLLENCGLISFEADAEKERMKSLINRYMKWEQTQKSSEIMAKNFKIVVEFDGEDVEVKVHRLFNRGLFYEAVLYSYKKPSIKRRGRKLQTRSDSSIKLLLLELACKKKIEQLQRQKGSEVIPKMPTYGSIFFMKSEYDTKEMLSFDEKGDQVVSYSFSPEEKRNIVLAYHDVDLDVNKESCNPSDCQTCPYQDLCKTDFVPRKKITPKSLEIKPINDIWLTPAQEKFVNFRKGQSRVNAVAGSGKTTIISLRTIALMEDGVEPEEILMLTFTDKACIEMRERVERYLKGSSLSYLELDPSKLNIATFNGWGQQILSEHYEKLGFQKEPKIIDDITKKDIIIKLLETYDEIPGLNYCNPFLNNVNAMGAVIEVDKLLDSMKAAHVETETDIQNIPKLKSTLQNESSTLLKIYKAYNQELIDRNLLDFEDQLRLILELKQFGVFESFPYKHIIVDEFQDCATCFAVKSCNIY